MTQSYSGDHPVLQAFPDFPVQNECAFNVRLKKQQTLEFPNKRPAFPISDISDER